MVNVYDHKFLALLASQKGKKRNRMNLVGSITNFITSKISFNFGGSFSAIRAPTLDYQGKPINASPEATLHLHTRDNLLFPQIYSQKNAPGLVIANGNVGVHLSFDRKEINTFISTNGGLDWRQVLKGVHIYEIGD